ncbi:MAG: PEP/pyruvate-binding domain-containing protein, partial [Bacteroidales bacterium]|nr:PEP/pyruvate-binding domain-containing protein [Bacteroidales bacterium]
SIPDEIFAFHARRNDFSKWLNARALFSLGKIFKNLRLTDFSNNIPEAKKFVYEAIAQYRISKSRGVIAQYERQEFDEFVTFSRIGSGSIGGKGRGLAFADSVLKKNIHLNQFENTLIGIPRTVVIATDIFDEFMELNNLYSTAIGNYNDQEIFEKFITARLPEHLMVDLQNYVKGVRKPIAVRSSSKLEDSQLLPFAGVYKTFMIPNVEKDVNRTLKILSEAIKCVYASLFYKETKAYFQSTGNNLMEEKMAVILQEVCGQKCCNLYFPLLSGVALSYNYYALPPETVEDGIAHIACGLGKYVVEGNQSFRFSPKHPQHALIHASTELFLKNQQRRIYALSLEPDAWKPSIDDTVNFVQIKPEDMLLHPGKSLIASKYDINNHQIVDNLLSEGKTIITFNGILKHRVVPLANILSELLETFEKELHAPVEIEFALETNPNELRKFQFYLLQLRPMYPNQRTYPVELPDITNTQTILAYSEHALGNGIFFNISDVVYVLPEKFDPSKTLLMAEEINSWNNLMKQQHKNYVLIGPGRWGSSDPWLGIPIRWHQISEAKIIIESLTENHPVDFSQGTHLFYNLISSGVIFMMIDQKQNPEFINFELLNSVGIHEDKEYTRWVHFEQPFTVITDGRKHKSIITF